MFGIDCRDGSAPSWGFTPGSTTQHLLKGRRDHTSLSQFTLSREGRTLWCNALWQRWQQVSLWQGHSCLTASDTRAESCSVLGGSSGTHWPLGGILPPGERGWCTLTVLRCALVDHRKGWLMSVINMLICRNEIFLIKKCLLRLLLLLFQAAACAQSISIHSGVISRGANAANHAPFIWAQQRGLFPAPSPWQKRVSVLLHRWLLSPCNSINYAGEKQDLS